MKTFKGYYVTTSGELYSMKTGAKKYTWHNKGRTSAYERVQFIVDGKPKNFYVHRIMAQLYLPDFDESLEVNHIDGNTLNNDISNLEVMTRSQNQQAYCNAVMIYKILRNTKCIFKEGKRA